MRRLKITKSYVGCWESPLTELGIWYIEARDTGFYCFHNHRLIHPVYQPMKTLSSAIQLCEDNYHVLKWG